MLFIIISGDIIYGFIDRFVFSGFLSTCNIGNLVDYVRNHIGGQEE